MNTDYNRGIPSPAPLSVLGPYPVETRLVVESIEDLKSMPIDIRYESLTVYVENEHLFYRLINGIQNENWVKIEPNIQEMVLNNIMDLTIQISHELNKPLKISNTIMMDLNSEDDIDGNIASDNGLLFF